MSHRPDEHRPATADHAVVDLGPASLRRWRPDDAADLNALVTANLDHLRPWMPWIATEPMTLTDRRALLERWEVEWDVGGDRHWAVVTDGRIAGSIGLMGRVGPGAVEIGYWLAAGCTGRGIATAAAGAVTTIALANPRIGRVEIHHDRANGPSGAVPRRLGYSLIAEQAVEITAPGECGINCVWAVTEDAWAGSGRHAPIDP